MMHKKFATFIFLAGLIAVSSLTLAARSGASATAVASSASPLGKVVIVGHRMTAAQKVNYDGHVKSVPKLADL